MIDFNPAGVGKTVGKLLDNERRLLSGRNPRVVLGGVVSLDDRRHIGFGKPNGSAGQVVGGQDAPIPSINLLIEIDRIVKVQIDRVKKVVVGGSPAQFGQIGNQVRRFMAVAIPIWSRREQDVRVWIGGMGG